MPLIYYTDMNTTPGPWITTRSTQQGWEIIAPERDERWLADVWTSEADARLISTAPDLLAVVRQLADMRLTAKARDYDSLVGAARLAIAKAEGQKVPS